MKTESFEEALARIATRHCPKLRARMSIASCHQFQSKHDAENALSYRDGSASTAPPHICMKWECEHYLPHSQRAKMPRRTFAYGDMKRKSDVIRTCTCYRCGETDQAKFLSYDKQSPGIGPITVLCKSCALEDRTARHTKTVSVKCPQCGDVRKVLRHTTLSNRFTARCTTCGNIAKRKMDLPNILTVTCPKCGQSRQITKGNYLKPEYTGVCGTCSQIVPHLCVDCGETEPAKFYPRKKSLCMTCDKKRRNSKRGSDLVQVMCPKCEKVRPVQRVVTVREGFTGLCVACAKTGKKQRKRRKVTLHPPVSLSCLGCKKSRVVDWKTTRKTKFDGECPACSRRRSLSTDT